MINRMSIDQSVARAMVNVKRNDYLLTIMEVAHQLHVHENTVRSWSNQGILKAYRIGSRGDRRFKQKDITLFLVQGPYYSD